ncbi:hypothetical protein GCM10028819_49910 [Spirosoma humi]
MFLTFTAIDKFGQIQDFSWWFASLEFALDVMSSLPAKGKQLVKAEILDDDHVIQLSVDGFDGNLFSTPLRQLEKEWQQLLKTPVEPSDVSAVHVDIPSFDERAWEMTTVKFED